MTGDLTFKTIQVEIEDGVAWATLDRPDKRNAMNPTLNAEITVEASKDYLVPNSLDRSKGRKQGIKQFIDDKAYRPNLGAYRK